MARAFFLLPQFQQLVSILVYIIAPCEHSLQAQYSEVEDFSMMILLEGGGGGGEQRKERERRKYRWSVGAGFGLLMR